MTADLSDYRDAIDAMLASAVDASTWTTAIKDQSLRFALSEYDEHFTYETSLTVSTTGYTQDISSVTAMKDILAVAYPWTDGADFATRQRRWRYSDDQTIHFEDMLPSSGEVMRLRHTKAHAIKDLDSATATTVPDRHQQLLAALAASYACVMRLRQVGENPAIPRDAREVLEATSRQFAETASRLFTRARAAQPAVWLEIGL